MKHIVIGHDGEACPRCGRPTEIREHKSITVRELARPFYYSRWFYCVDNRCRTKLIMRPEFRVFNDHEASAPLAAARQHLAPEQDRRLDAVIDQLTPPW